MRVKLVQWNIWCGMNDKLTCQPWAKCATHAAIKIFLSPSPIKFWSQIPRIKNTGLSAQIKTRARTLIVNFIYGAPCLHKMVRKEDRLTLSNHFIKGRYPLGCTLSQIVLKVGINKTSGSKVKKSDFPPKNLVGRTIWRDRVCYRPIFCYLVVWAEGCLLVKWMRLWRLEENEEWILLRHACSAWAGW